MDTRVLPVPMDPATAAMFRLDGQDPDEMEALFARVLSYTHYALPDPPVSVDARLCALLPQHSVDGVSRLPDLLLRNIVSRLPVKEGARTATLSRRWRRSGALPPAATAVAGTASARSDARRITSTVSRIIAAHPGPFRCVHLTSSHMEEFHGLLTRWLRILANKGIQELVLVNRPWPLDLVLPSTFLGMTTLTRLYLGLWKFPDTAGIPSATCLPNLLELGLCSLVMESKDLDFILDRSPVLETLYIHGNLFKVSLRLVNQSLQIAVVDAPRLERLILTGCWSSGGVCTKVKIGYAPKLHSLGYLDSGSHDLEFGNTVIKAGTKVSPSTMVPSVRVLALEVRCGVRNDVKMIPTVLRCFPNSGKTGQPSGKHNLKFWNESGTIECISSRIKLLVFHDYRGDRSELAFLKFFFESALVLKHVVIVLANAWFTSMEDMHSKVNPLRSMKRASAGSKIMVTGCSDPEDGGMGNFKRASASSVGDPFVNF
ncbi:hypothetical protein VPH35_066492 [Triticum aestivum]